MDLEGLKTNAYGASEKAATMAGSLPTVLNDLKGSLNEIFNKDNPLVKERTGHLETYLAAPDKARAEYLPQNSGQVYSPTELNALVSSRKASALAPLAGINQMLMGQYGGLKDYLGNARDLFSAAVSAAAQRAEIARQQYTDALAEQARQDALKQQEFENQLAREKFAYEKSKGGGGGVGNLSSILAGLGLGSGNNNYPTPARYSNQVYGPTRAEFVQPTAAPDQSMSYVPNIANEQPFYKRWWGNLFGTSDNLGLPQNLNISGGGTAGTGAFSGLNIQL